MIEGDDVMSKNLNFQISIFKKLQKYLEGVKFKTVFREPTPEIPIHSLVTLFEGIGDRNDSVMFEFYFLPIQEEEADKNGINILQIYATIKEDIKPQYFNELYKAISTLNPFMPVGAFGLAEESGSIYMKYNMIILSGAGEDAAIQSIDLHFGFILKLVDSYTDLLTDIADGIKTTAGAKADGFFPS